jgi:hypothetical protein
MAQVKMCLAALQIMLLVSGCAAQNQGVRPLRPLELTTAAYQEVSTAAFTGSLMYEGGCLLFRDDRSSGPLLPVWQTGSVFNGTSLIFHEPGRPDQPVLVTQHIFVRGRAVSWSELPPTIFAPFQHQCGGWPFMVSGIRPAN